MCHLLVRPLGERIYIICITSNTRALRRRRRSLRALHHRIRPRELPNNGKRILACLQLDVSPFRQYEASQLQRGERPDVGGKKRLGDVAGIIARGALEEGLNPVLGGRELFCAVCGRDAAGSARASCGGAKELVEVAKLYLARSRDVEGLAILLVFVPGSARPPLFALGLAPGLGALRLVVLPRRALTAVLAVGVVLAAPGGVRAVSVLVPIAIAVAVEVVVVLAGPLWAVGIPVPVPVPIAVPILPPVTVPGPITTLGFLLLGWTCCKPRPSQT